MAKDYHINWSAHPNIYNSNSERTFNVYFSEPDLGVTEDTGILLLIAGFGGNANSKVYAKMRQTFADKYNLVTVQCDYFGHEFMQASQNLNKGSLYSQLQNIVTPAELNSIFRNGLDFSAFTSVGKNYNSRILVDEMLEESISNFNDMGIMQALDNITAVCYVVKILQDNGYQFNSNKIIAYGHSHGAYLSYLCNVFAPNLFTLLIDNSSWLFPLFLKGKRYTNYTVGNILLGVSFEYLASQIEMDETLLYLPNLYTLINTSCEVYCFHGTNDTLIPHTLKRAFCNDLPLCHYHEISEAGIDGHIFKSTTHGLGADFLALFDFVMGEKQFEKSTIFKLTPMTIESPVQDYYFDYTHGIPLLRTARKGLNSN